jgi:hypothetical protein
LQTIVFLYKEIRGVRNVEETVLRINFFPDVSYTIYISKFFVAKYYGLRNTPSWGSKDLALVCYAIILFGQVQ